MPKSHTELLEELKIMCGMGRTGTLHACAQENVRPDIMIIAKGLGGGYQPIGAMLASGEISDAIAAGSGDFQHGHTYIGHATACAAALAVQQTVRDERLLDAVRARGAELAAAFAQHLGSHPHVGDIRGRGLFWGLELVSDRAGKTPFDPALKMHARVKREAMACGHCCYPMGHTVSAIRFSSLRRSSLPQLRSMSWLTNLPRQLRRRSHRPGANAGFCWRFLHLSWTGMR